MAASLFIHAFNLCLRGRCVIDEHQFFGRCIPRFVLCDGCYCICPVPEALCIRIVLPTREDRDVLPVRLLFKGVSVVSCDLKSNAEQMFVFCGCGDCWESGCAVHRIILRTLNPRLRSGPVQHEEVGCLFPDIARLIYRPCGHGICSVRSEEPGIYLRRAALQNLFLRHLSNRRRRGFHDIMNLGRVLFLFCGDLDFCVPRERFSVRLRGSDLRFRRFPVQCEGEVL